MRILLIAIGNPLRRDDGVAQAALAGLAPAPGVEKRSVMQLTPELSSDIAGYDEVVFLDADADAKEIRIEPVAQAPLTRPVTHTSHPSEVVAFARLLYGFAGEALLCRIPAVDFSVGEGLSRKAKISARRAAAALEHITRSQKRSRRCAPLSSVSAI